MVYGRKPDRDSFFCGHILSGFLAGIGETGDFNEKLFHRLVDHATVYPDGRVVFTFRNRVEVRTEI